MPRTRNSGKSETLNLRLKASEVARLDALRGSLSRQDWLRSAIAKGAKKEES